MGFSLSHELDEVDRGILRRLQEDARLAFRKIADDLGVSESTVFVRVRKLQEGGVIRGFSAVVSPEAVGKGLTAFILIRADPRRYSSVLEALSAIEDIYEIYDVTGNYYAIAKVRTGDRGDLARVIDEIGLIEGIASTETAIVLRNIKEERTVKV